MSLANRPCKCLIDLWEKRVESPAEALYELLGVPLGSVVSLSTSEVMKLFELARGSERYPLFINIKRDNKLFHLGVFPLEFTDKEERFLEAFFYDADGEYRRQAEAESSLRLIRALADNAGAAILISLESTILGASYELLTFWGYTGAEIEGRLFTSLIAPSDKALVGEQLTKRQGFSEEVMCLRKNGTQFKAVIATERRVSGGTTYIVARLSGGDLPYNIGGWHDSTYSLINFIPALVAIGSADSLQFVNRAFLDFFAYPDIESFLRKYSRINELFTQRKGYLHSRDKDWLEQAGELKKRDYNIKTLIYSIKAKEYRTFIFTFQKLRNSDTYIFLLIDISDITTHHFVLQDVNQMLEQEVEKQSRERQQTALLLKQQEELLVQQSKLATMGNMINIITHQWKQPLSTIGLLVQNLEDDYTDGELTEDNIKETVGNVMKQVKYMAETIDDFRNFFRPSKTLVQFEVAEPISSVCNLLKPMMNRASIHVISRGDTDMPKALGLPGELKQVLMGLMINAKDAIVERYEKYPNSAESAHHIGNIWIDLSTDFQNVIVYVTDDGGGIPPDIIGTVFDAYVSTKGDKGTGIGLYISKIAMGNMNGSISVSNTETGARFTVTIPRA